MIMFIDFLLKSLFFLLPAAFANMAPIFVKKIRFLNYPIDFGYKFNSRRIFGENKTWRGFVSAISLSLFIIFVQKLLYQFDVVKIISIIDYDSTNILVLGLLFGLGAMLGDLVESFIKRQIDILPGRKLIIFDQLDWVVGSMLFAMIYVDLELYFVLYVFGLFLILHILVKHIGFYLGLEDKKW